MWWIGLSFLMQSPSSASGETDSPAVMAQCRAAAEIIRDVILPEARRTQTRRILFDQKVHAHRDGEGPLENRFALRPTAPPSRLLSKLNGQVNVSAVARCADVRRLLARQRVRFDKRSIESGRRLNRDLDARAVIHGVSLPVLSEDGTEVLFAHTVFRGGRNASGDLMHLKRDLGGRWTVVREHFLWVS